MTTSAAPVSPTRALPAGDPHDGFFLWGAPKAGKSGFIGALYGLSRADEGERWTAHPKDCDDPHTQEMVLRAYEELCERRNTKTGVRDTPYRPLKLTLRRMSGGREERALQVALVDPAGEFSSDAAHRLSFAGKALYRQVATSHGLLWLFEATPDGATSTLDRLLILEQLVALLDAGGAVQLDLPVALCLSKIDCLPEDRRRAALANPTQALLDHLGATSLTWFEAVCPTLRCFAVSSAGVVPDKVRPIGVNEVLDWLDAERTRRIREEKAAALRVRALDAVKRWSGRVIKGSALVALVAGVAYGGMSYGDWGLGTGDSAGTAGASGPGTSGLGVNGAKGGNGGGVIPRGAGEAAREPAQRADEESPSSRERGSSARAQRDERTAPKASANRERESRGELARRPPARFDERAQRDSMTAAFEEALERRREGEPAQRWFRSAHLHASRLIERRGAASRASAPDRLLRARACVLGDLDCGRAAVSEDLTWVLIHGDDAQRRTAVRILRRLGG